jgi:hypothetical protein
MSKTAEYIVTLQNLADWPPYLMQASGLPGPRGNLELAHVVAQVGTRAQFDQLLSFAPIETNTPQEFLVFCGALGLGKLIADGDLTQLPRLRAYASDKSWRVREAAATALQLVGDKNMDLLLQTASLWSQGSWLEKRAAAAALAEPRLLKTAENAQVALTIINAITESIANADDRSGDDFKILRQAMGYCWSVVVAALPDPGKKLMEKWLINTNKDISWMMRENLKKNRLLKADPLWTQTWQTRQNLS